MTEADIIIIGAGPGRRELGGLALKQNRRVVVIERDHIGGTCLNRGCIPTKALCKSAEVVNTVKEASQFGIDVTGFSLSYATAFQRKNEVVKGLGVGGPDWSRLYFPFREPTFVSQAMTFFRWILCLKIFVSSVAES